MTTTMVCWNIANKNAAWPDSLMLKVAMDTGHGYT